MERKDEKKLTPAVLVYSHSTTPRLEYVVHFLSQYFGQPFRLTADEATYLGTEASCRINYSYHRLIAGETWIHPHPLLFESAVHVIKTECFTYHGYKAFFAVEGDWGFDLFAGIFYLLTRYEEYLPHKKDAYGRYDHQASLAFREDFLHLPLVNTWLEDLRKVLAQRNPVLATPAQSFRFIPTYDIDMAWSFKNKGFRRNAGAMIALLLKLRWRSLGRRIAVLRGKAEDPFDAYQWMDEQHATYHLDPVYFFLVAQATGKYDKNISLDNPSFRDLILQQAKKYRVGLHPSWASGDEPRLLKKERSWLEQATHKSVHLSRQHFIRFELPHTYRHLLEAGITEDHSMGYGTINGFRASVATPFYWYDLKHEEETKLLLYPFCFMDANSYYELKQTPAEALAEMQQYRLRIEAVRGTMVTIWHNSFLGIDPAFEGWREVYGEFLAGTGSLATKTRRQ